MTKDEKYYVLLKDQYVYGPFDSASDAVQLVEQLFRDGTIRYDITICRNIPFHTEVSTRVVIDEE